MKARNIRAGVADNRVAPGVIQRSRSSGDRRLHKPFKGRRGVPFTRTGQLQSAELGQGFGSTHFSRGDRLVGSEAGPLNVRKRVGTAGIMVGALRWTSACR